MDAAGISPLLVFEASGIMFCLCYFLFIISTLSVDKGWTDRNADCCVNTVDEKLTTATNLVNFGHVTPEILWLICMNGDCREAHIRTVLVKGHSTGGSSIACP